MDKLVTHTERSWRVMSPGVDFCTLRSEAGRLTLLIRVAAGAAIRRHDHPGGEDNYLLSGRVRLGGHELTAGDYLWTDPGVPHEGVALEDSLFFVVAPAGFAPG